MPLNFGLGGAEQFALPMTTIQRTQSIEYTLHNMLNTLHRIKNKYYACKTIQRTHCNVMQRIQYLEYNLKNESKVIHGT